MFTRVKISAVSSAAHDRSPCEKSKRSRSGPTNEPCWRTWSPKTVRSPACRRWVAVWLRRVASRRSGSIVGDRDLTGQHLAGQMTAVREESAGDVLDVEHLEAARLGDDRPGVGDLTAGLGVEGRRVEEQFADAVLADQ